MIRKQRDFVLQKHHCETPKGVSLTVPDESYTVREILEKFTTGIDLRQELMRQPSYDSGASFDSEDLEKIQNEDLYEKQQHIEKFKIFQEKHKNKPRQSTIAGEASFDAPPPVEANKTAKKADDVGSSENSGE